MIESAVTSKGRTTLPKAVRRSARGDARGACPLRHLRQQRSAYAASPSHLSPVWSPETRRPSAHARRYEARGARRGERAMFSQRWVRRSSRAVVIFGSPKTDGHSPKVRFVAKAVEAPAANAPGSCGRRSPHSSLGYRPPAPETIVMPSWPPGSAPLRRPANLAEKPAMH